MPHKASRTDRRTDGRTDRQTDRQTENNIPGSGDNKPSVRSLTGPTQFVVRPIFSPKMTSENATRDRSQGTFWRKSAISNSKGQFFIFFFFLSWRTNTGNANKRQISNAIFLAGGGGTQL